MKNEFDVEHLKQQTAEMISAITSPKFVEAMRKIRATPVEERSSLGMKILTPENLRSQGVPLPAGMRISSRYFETDTPGSVVGIAPSASDYELTVNDSGTTIVGAPKAHPLNAGMCAGGGAGTVCGCAGSSLR